MASLKIDSDDESAEIATPTLPAKLSTLQQVPAGLLIAPPHKNIITTRRSLLYAKSGTTKVSWDPQLTAKKWVADIKAQGTRTTKAITTKTI